MASFWTGEWHCFGVVLLWGQFQLILGEREDVAHNPYFVGAPGLSSVCGMKMQSISILGCHRFLISVLGSCKSLYGAQ